MVYGGDNVLKYVKQKVKKKRKRKEKKLNLIVYENFVNLCKNLIQISYAEFVFKDFCNTHTQGCFATGPTDFKG